MNLLIPIPFSIIACYTDIKETKIRNHTTYPLIILGIATNTYLFGLEGLKYSIEGFLIVIFLLTLTQKIFSFGGGDIKLIMGYGTFLGSLNSLRFIFILFLLNLLVNIAMLIKKHNIKEIKSILKLEIFSYGQVRYGFPKIIGAPLALTSYLVCLIFMKGVF